jgi:hypothetical protein
VVDANGRRSERYLYLFNDMLLVAAPKGTEITGLLSNALSKLIEEDDASQAKGKGRNTAADKEKKSMPEVRPSAVIPPLPPPSSLMALFTASPQLKFERSIPLHGIRLRDAQITDREGMKHAFEIIAGKNETFLLAIGFPSAEERANWMRDIENGMAELQKILKYHQEVAMKRAAERAERIKADTEAGKLKVIRGGHAIHSDDMKRMSLATCTCLVRVLQDSETHTTLSLSFSCPN